ncbi:sigma factor [Dactylosporangium sp. NPDC000555]|uniref:RNA polymerase sigma factor n=1 Tax=Dactylosporangium sp. NPDC000555 TaxID=3154260 RepID=UPI00331CE753
MREADYRELLRLVGKGDRRAFEAFYARNAPWLALRLRRRCRDAELADEMLQEAFLTVWRAAGSYRGDGEVVGWSTRSGGPAVLLAPTLAGADDELERGTALPWRRWRLGHLLLAAAAIGGPLALTGLRAPEVFGAYALLRNTLGCVGLVALGATLLGARLAWLPVFGYVCAVYGAAPRQIGGVTGVWAWPAQPSSVTTSWLTAGALFAIGTLWYAARGAQRDARAWSYRRGSSRTR